MNDSDRRVPANTCRWATIAFMEIQRLDIEDWQRLEQLRLAALKDAPQAFDSTYDDAKQFTEEDWSRQIEELASFVAVDDGKDFGMVRGVPSDTENSSAFLISMWVAANGRGSGACEKLIGAVINWARQSGFTRLELDVADDNAPAITLYERCNFLPSGETGSLSPPRTHVLEHRCALIL